MQGDFFLGPEDVSVEIERIVDFIKGSAMDMKRTGAVVGLSGGIDSAVTASLCVEALGRENVFGLIMPEKESDPMSRELALELGNKLGIETAEVDITPILESAGIYSIRERSLRDVMGEIPPGARWNISLPGNLNETRSLNIYRLNVRMPDGPVVSKRLGKEAMREIMPATNVKQRTRMMLLYSQAERRNYLVAGTTNRSEYLMGYFVKYGDGGVDMEPISHLFKTEVYMLAKYLQVPESILQRIPSPDTFSEFVSDNDFFFRMEYHELDRFIAGWEMLMDPEDIASVTGKDIEFTKRILSEIQKRYDVSTHLRVRPSSMQRRSTN